MAPNTPQPDAVSQAVLAKFEEREFKPAVDALYAQVPDTGPVTLDFDKAQEIDFINSDTRDLIRQKVPNHELLFQKNFTERVGGGEERKKAFAAAVKDVYMWALYEEEVWSAEEMEDEARNPLQAAALKFIKKVVSIPLDTFGTSGRPELRAMLKHVSAINEEEAVRFEKLSDMVSIAASHRFDDLEQSFNALDSSILSDPNATDTQIRIFRNEMMAVANPMKLVAEQISANNDLPKDVRVRAQEFSQEYDDYRRLTGIPDANQIASFLNNSLRPFIVFVRGGIDFVAKYENGERSFTSLFEAASKPKGISGEDYSARKRLLRAAEEKKKAVADSAAYFEQSKYKKLSDAAIALASSLDPEKVPLGGSNFFAVKLKRESEVEALGGRVNILSPAQQAKEVRERINSDRAAWNAEIDAQTSKYAKAAVEKEAIKGVHLDPTAVKQELERRRAINKKATKRQVQLDMAGVTIDDARIQAYIAQHPELRAKAEDAAKKKLETKVASEQTSKRVTHARKISRKKDELRNFRAAENAGGKFYEQLESFMEHLKVANDNGVLSGLSYSTLHNQFEQLSKDSSPTELMDFYNDHLKAFLEASAGAVAPVDSLVANFDKKIAELDDEVGKAKAMVEEAEAELAKVRNLSDAAAAKRVIAAILQRNDTSLSEADANDFAATILRKDMRLLQNGESAQEIAEREASNTKLESIEDAWIKRNILSYGFKDGEDIFEGFGVDDFRDPKKIIEAIDDGRLDMSEESGKSAMLAMAAIMIYEERMNIKFTGLRALEDKLKDMIAEELGEDLYQDESGSAAVVAAQYTRELKEAKRAMSAHVKNLDENKQAADNAKLAELVAKMKKLKEERLRDPKKWPDWRYDAEYELLLDEAREYGLEGEFEQAAVMEGFTDSPHFTRMEEFFVDLGIGVGKKGLRVLQGGAEAGARLTGKAIGGTAKGALSIVGGAAGSAVEIAKAPLFLAAKPGYWALNFVRRKQLQPPSVIGQVKKAAHRTLVQNTVDLAKGTGKVAASAVTNTVSVTGTSVAKNFGKSKIKIREHSEHSKTDVEYLKRVAEREAEMFKKKSKRPLAAKARYSRKKAEADVKKLADFRKASAAGKAKQVKKAA